MVKKNILGFTLLEMVLVTAVIAVVGVMSASMVVTILKSYNRSNNSSQVSRVGQALVFLFENQIRNAVSVSVESGEEIRYTITNADGEDVQYSLRFVSKDCLSDNSNNLISLSSLSGSVYPEISITPTNIDTGINVSNVSFTDVDGIIEFEFTLEQSCNTPQKNEFAVSKTYQTKVVPRLNYGN